MDSLFLKSLGSVTELETGLHWRKAELQDQILRRARRYRSLGVVTGDRVVLLHKNNNAFFADLIGLWLLGACVCCLDEAIGQGEFDGLAGELSPRLIVTKGDPPAQLADSLAAFAVADTDLSDPPSPDPGPDFAGLTSDDPALILYTSGSTGLPKGVVHSRRTLQAKWSALGDVIPLEVCERTLCLLPTNFGHGLICNALFPLVNDRHLFLMARTDMASLSKLGQTLDAHAITFMSSVPAIWRMALRLSAPPANGTLRRLHVGSAPLGEALWGQIQKWTPHAEVWNTYGITETGSWISGGRADASTPPREGLVGQAWGSTFRIVKSGFLQESSDPTDPMDAEIAPLAVGETGDIWVRTAAAMLGYFNRAPETRKVMHGDWFKTGDLGRMDAQGNLYLTGRVRNEINKGGTKISPEELDLILEKHPDIDEACTFAIDDKVYGENIGACLVLGKQAPAFSRTQLAAWGKANMSSHKIPAVWYQVAEIPKNARGKIKRSDVREYCQKLEAL